MQEIPGECNFPTEMEYAGIGNRLCHHASPAQAQRAKEILSESLRGYIFEGYMDRLFAGESFTDVTEYAIREVLQEDFDVVPDFVRDIVRAAFLRYISVSSQILMLEIIIHLNESSLEE